MAVKKVKRGDLVAITVPGYNVTYKCAINKVRNGVTGTMIHYDHGKTDTLYFEKQDLEHMRRLKVSQVPKALAELAKKWRNK